MSHAQQDGITDDLYCLMEKSSGGEVVVKAPIRVRVTQRVRLRLI